MPHHDTGAVGYLVWPKIDWEYLESCELPDLLSWDIGQVSALVGLHAAKQRMLETVQGLKARHIRHVRLGVSWAEWTAPYGKEWIRWYLRLFEGNFRILPCLTYTPPAMAEIMLGAEPSTNTPPRDLLSYAAFVDAFLREFGAHIAEVELWNEPDLDTDWNRNFDTAYRKLTLMLAAGALVARHHGKRVVLGGVSGVNDRSLKLIRTFAQRGFFRFFDAVGFHDLRGTWSDQHPRPSLITQIVRLSRLLSLPASIDFYQFHERLLALIQRDKGELGSLLVSKLRGFDAIGKKWHRPEIWLTEYGFPACREGLDGSSVSLEELEDIQVALFASMARLVRDGVLPRAYWYTLQDHVCPSVRLATTGWEDPLQHHYGDTQEDGTSRKLGRLLLEGGVRAVLRYAMDMDVEKLVDRASLGRQLPQQYKSNIIRAAN